MSVTNYTPSRCRYRIENLKSHIYLFSSATNNVHIDDGEVYVDSISGDFLRLDGVSVQFTENASYNDRFSFTKSVTVVCDGYVSIPRLEGKYYIIILDDEGNSWMVNYDFPSYVTYTYTLNEVENNTEFVFNVLSNFPLMKFNKSFTDYTECKQYNLGGIKSLKMLEKYYANINPSENTVYGYSNTTYKIIEFNKGSLSLTEEYDGVNVTTNLSFDIDLDGYKPSWQYNLLEYDKNKYVAIINGQVAVGFDNGLIPSYEAQGSDNVTAVDKYTITLQGSSQRGLYISNKWNEVVLEPQYTWKLSKEWQCTPIEYRWVDSGTTCIKYDKYQRSVKQYTIDGGDTWQNVEPLVESATTLIEMNSADCGYIPYSASYLTMVALEDSDNISVYNEHKLFSVDGGNTWSSAYTGSISAGDEILIKGEGQYYNHENIITSGFSFNLQGNIASVFRGDDFLNSNLNVIAIQLFSYCTDLISAENVYIPSKVYNSLDLSYLFYGCINLKKAPVMPNEVSFAVTVNFEGMFKNCISLEEAPELPNQTLSNGNYRSMFEGCTSLVTPPTVLPSLNVPTNAYRNMFYGCTSLETAPRISAITVAASACTSMFYGCTSLTEAPELPATTVENYCYRDMFNRCTSLETAPTELPATTLANGCYYNMFNRCTSLETAPRLPATTLANNCYRQMFYGCSSLNTITCLATSISASYCTDIWVSGVAARGTFYKNPSMTSWSSGDSGIPNGWTVYDYT